MRLSLRLIVVGLCLQTAPQLWACTCVAFEFARDVDKYAFILRGEAVELSEHRVAGPFGRMIDVSFRVLRVWKGEVPPDVTIRTSAHEPACGYPFVAGRQYVVFVQRDLSPVGGAHWLLKTSSCAPTKAAAEASELVSQLDAHFGKQLPLLPNVGSSAAEQ